MILNYINWNVDPEIFSLFGISLRYYRLLFVGGLVFCVYVLKGIFRNENIPPDYLDKLTVYGFIGIFVGSLFSGPILEEILFRGILLKGLLTSNSPKKAIIISSIIFGLIHGQPVMIAGAILLGSFLGYIYYKTNSLGLTILMHFAANLFCTIAYFLNQNLGNPNFKTIADLYGSYSWLLMLVLILTFTVSSYYLVKKINASQF